MDLKSGISIICLSIALVPWLEDLLKIYLIAMVAILTLTVNVAFRMRSIWEWIIEKALQEVIKRLMQDEDMKKIIKMRFDAMIKRAKEHKHV